MVSVREEPDGFSQIGGLEGAERTCWALGNLQKAKEDTDHADGKEHEA